MRHVRVTEVLKYYTNFHKIPPDILSKAAARGTTVHALCAAVAKGAWVPDSMIEEELKGYMQSFYQWVSAQVDDFQIVEKRFYDDVWGFSGQVDFVIVGNDKKLYLADLKTGAHPSDTYPIQMAAYVQLLKKNGIEVHGAMIVYLKRDGQFPDIHLLEDLEEETHIWSCALYCYKYFNKEKTDVSSRSRTQNNTAAVTSSAESDTL